MFWVAGGLAGAKQTWSRTASTRSPMCCRSSWVGRRTWPPRSLAHGCSSANSCRAVLARGSTRLLSVTRFVFLVPVASSWFFTPAPHRNQAGQLWGSKEHDPDEVLRGLFVGQLLGAQHALRHPRVRHGRGVQRHVPGQDRRFLLGCPKGLTPF